MPAVDYDYAPMSTLSVGNEEVTRAATQEEEPRVLNEQDIGEVLMVENEE